MKALILSVIILFTVSNSFAQSNPVALKPGIGIQRLMTVKNGVIRMERDEVDNQLYYILTSGEIYKVIQPGTGSPYDTLVCSVTQHGVQYVQGMVFRDSTWYLLGNQNSNSALTSGIIVRGKLQPNGQRTWDTLMHTQNYQTNGAFDHLFSGITLSPAGDTVYISSGARGDHGEIETRNGLYPGLRNVPLTTNIFCLPTHNATTITLMNDSMWLDTSGYLFARGVRNHFDMAFDQHGNLFALENSGDRDHNEEMNWLQRGKHYGFPWVMGNTYNPQQFSWFNPNADSLINHNSRSWRFGAWSNDPGFPQPPAGQVFELPIPNYGPDCDKFRDSLDVVHDASDEGIPIYSFTAHRSPLGLVFDNQNVLGPLYRGDAFMFSWTEGYDSTGSPPPPDSTHIGPFNDPSQDMVHLDLIYDSIAGNFRMNATRIIADFINPVDAEIDSNKVYLIENGYGNTSGLFVITLPVETNPCAPAYSVVTPDLCNPDSNAVVVPEFGQAPCSVNWFNSNDSLLRADTALSASDTLMMLPSGTYYFICTDGGACASDTIAFSIADELSMTIDSVHHTTCIGCNDGQIYVSVFNGMPPYTYTPSLTNVAAGTYTVCVTDAGGCMKCDTTTVLDDPLLVRENQAEKSIGIYPNPAANNLSLTNNSGGTISVKIFDDKGKLIMTEYEISESKIDIGKLQSGIYYLSVQSGEKTFNRKLVVVKP
jgi:hypothetical protein